MWRSSPLRCAALTLSILSGACGGDDTQKPSTTVTYKATLTGAAEVPAVATTATGNATVTVDAAKNLTYTATFSGLSSGLVGAHIHGPAAPGNNAGVIVPFTITSGITAGTIGPTTVALTTSLTGAVSADSLIALLNAGKAYVNIHSTNHVGGEIRGWLTRQ